MDKSPTYAVSVDKLEKRFGTFTAVNRISFDVKPGEIFGFLGPNGAGKSTTIRMLCGILTPTSGTGHVGGFDIIRQQDKIKEHIGYMSQKFSLYDDLTVEENINFYSGIYTVPDKKERKEMVLKLADIEDLRSSLTRNLSGGWKQRLALGCAILHKPNIVFLDEPTSGVDPIARRNFWDIIKDMSRNGVTVFVTTHYMDEAENCNRMVLIYKGTIIAMGTPHELKTTVMKDAVLEVEVPRSEEWAEKIKAMPSVKDTALFGNNLHAVVYDEAAAVAAIRAAFTAAGVGASVVQKIEPSLEDVFVSLIETYDREHPTK